MKLLFEHEAARVFLLDDGLVQVEDKMGLLFTKMVSGPVGSEPGDNIKCMVWLPGLDRAVLPFKQQVTFWLGRTLPSEGYIPSRAHGGDSLVTIGESVYCDWPATSGVTIRTHVLANEKGQLSGVGCQLNVENAQRAEGIAYQFLNAVLSTVTYELRVPVYVQRVEVLDLGQDPTLYYVTLHKHFPPADWNAKASLPTPQRLERCEPWRRALAFYRESLVLNLPMYRFLALYKGLEDLERTRAFLYKLAQKNGSAAKFPTSFLPNHQFFKQHFPDLIGKPVSEGEKHLKSGYRNFTAHSVLGDGSYMTSDLRYGMVNYANLCSLADVTFRSIATSTKAFADTLAAGGDS